MELNQLSCWSRSNSISIEIDKNSIDRINQLDILVTLIQMAPDVFLLTPLKYRFGSMPPYRDPVYAPGPEGDMYDGSQEDGEERQES